MGKKYSQIRIVSHSLYTVHQPSKTIYIKDDIHEYSEAFAGSGEGRLILLADQILNASEKSLILIDEPEISLHPSAQERFKLFLLEEILHKKHQIIISTHSPHMIHLLPNSAIKVFIIEEQKQNVGAVAVYPNVSYLEAFNEIGHIADENIHIYCEDMLVEYIFNYYIEKYKIKLKNAVNVLHLPGGADTIITQNLRVAAAEKRPRDFYYFDGDMNRYPFETRGTRLKKDKKTSDLKLFMPSNTKKISSKDIPQTYDDYLNDIICAITGSQVKFYPDGNSGTSNEKQLIQLMRDYIDYWNEFVFFLPEDTPEIALIKEQKKQGWDSLTKANSNSLSSDTAKDAFCNLARSELGKKDVTSEEIFLFQKMAVASLAEKSTLFLAINSFLDSTLQIK